MKIKVLHILLGISLSPTLLMAQLDIPDNLPKFDNRIIHFGFQLGASSNGFSLDPRFVPADSLAKIEVSSQPGFIIHAVSELHIGPYFGLRITPGIVFASRNIEYSYFNKKGTVDAPIVRSIESTFVEIPLFLKYRSKRVNNFAQYVLAGFNYSYDLASQQYSDNKVDAAGEFIVKLKKANYNLEVGVGFDFFLEYFKFSPEFKFSYGLNNIVVPEQTKYAAPISDLRSRIFVFAINFEG